MSKKRKALTTERKNSRIQKNTEPLNSAALRIDDICGIWYSYSIFPTLLIFQDRKKYKLCIMTMDDVGQARPEIHNMTPEIENEYSLIFTLRGTSIKYNTINDVLSHPEYGNYFRECK